MSVTRFVGRYRFLSNFWPCAIKGPGGWTYATVEHAYQAWKTNDQQQWVVLASRALMPTPGIAKRYSRQLSLRPDWESIKLQVMDNLLRQKFAPGSDLHAKLLATEGEIVEGNTWGDVFWGVCNGIGENHLGKLLMSIRDQSK
jgi:ribA/ribD-fused uncharacterized protein